MCYSAVNVPTDLTPVCMLLPRLLTEMQMVTMKLKRKLATRDTTYISISMCDQ